MKTILITLVGLFLIFGQNLYAEQDNSVQDDIMEECKELAFDQGVTEEDMTAYMSECITETESIQTEGEAAGEEAEEVGVEEEAHDSTKE